MDNKETVKCPKCDGQGTIRAFSHRAGGKCFLCGGAGRINIRSQAAKQHSLTQSRDAVISNIKAALDENNIAAAAAGWVSAAQHGYRNVAVRAHSAGLAKWGVKFNTLTMLRDC